MTSQSTDLIFSVPMSSNDHTEELRNVEAAASRALKNIQSLYNQIMTPKPYTDFEAESFSETELDSPTIALDFPTTYSPIPSSRSGRDAKVNNAHPKPCIQLRKSCNNETNFNNVNVNNRRKLSLPSDDNSLDMPLNNAHKSVLISNQKFKVTVPKPFSLTAENIKRQQARELKITKLKEEIDKQIDKELNVKFICKPVPKHVNLPLYGEMVAKSEKRKIERKEKCHEIMEKVLKPFELSYMKTGLTKSQSMGNLSKGNLDGQFKAKPLPKSIFNENISKKLKDKEEIRKMLIAQRAEEMLKQSSLPFTPKCVPYSYSFMSEEKKDQVKLSKAEIDAITKRLYTLKCREAMEEWNKKVLRNDLWHDETCNSKNKAKNNDTSHKNSKVQFDNTLPFYNFPVRMSNATVLRDKHVRAEILKRERREETDQMIREEMEKKFVKNIWPRLKSMETTINFEKDIEEKVKSYRASQKSREQEYSREIEEMMERVSKQFLLIERVAKEPKTNVESENENDSDEKPSSESSDSDEKPSSEKQEVNDTVSDVSDEYTDKVESSSLQPSDD